MTAHALLTAYAAQIVRHLHGLQSLYSQAVPPDQVSPGLIAASSTTGLCLTLAVHHAMAGCAECNCMLWAVCFTAPSVSLSPCGVSASFSQGSNNYAVCIEQFVALLCIMLYVARHPCPCCSHPWIAAAVQTCCSGSQLIGEPHAPCLHLH
jgi:hypothetical protein